MSRRSGLALAGGILLGALSLIGYWLLFSSFAIHDDEGYILISVREYLARGRLYELVYSQYGPAFYVLMDFFQRLLGAPVDHTSARLLTLALWLANSGCCAILVWRQTASRSLTLFTLAATFLYLYYVMDEPFHPGSTIFFVLSVSLCLTVELMSRGRLAGAAAVAGGTAAILLLTKINVGAFYVAGVGAWAARHAVSLRTGRFPVRLVVTGLLILFAAALMKTLIHETWVQTYLVLFAIGAITLVAGQPDEASLTAKSAGWFLGTGFGLGLGILSLVWLRGTSPAGLIEGVLLGPLRHPVNYSYPVDWRPGSFGLAGISLATALALPGIRRRFSDEIADRLIVALRFGLLAAVLTGFACLLEHRAVGVIFSYVAPLIWVWAVPLHGVKPAPAALAGRTLLATVLLLQFLHAYPVGGSQESWGTFLFMPLVALGLGETRQWLAGRTVAGIPPGRAWPACALLIMAVVIGKVGATARSVQQNYASRQDLGLPGAGALRLPATQRSDYRILSLNATVHADLLFSLPGMFSFNLWTGLPPPTGRNTTLWFTLLSNAEQQEIIQALDRSSRPVIIVQQAQLASMQARGIQPAGPLLDHIRKNFTPAFTLDDFAFLVRTGRTIAPLNLAEMSVRRDPDPTGLEPDTQLDFCVVQEGRPIAAIEVGDETTPPAARLILNSANARLDVTPINRAGRAMSPPGATAWPLRGQGLIRVSVRFNRAGHPLLPGTTVLALKGPRGEVIDEIRLGE